MDVNLKKSYIDEINFQRKMLDTLQRWITWSIALSSLSLVLIYFGSSFHPLMKVFGIILIIVAIVSMILLGLAIRNGRNNLLKIIQKFEKMKNS